MAVKRLPGRRLAWVAGPAAAAFAAAATAGVAAASAAAVAATAAAAGAGVAAAALPPLPALSPPSSPLRPHIVVILLDDWGWANWGVHARTAPNAAEVVTPRLDAAAAAGVELARHYAFRFCSPSRSALLTGRNPIHVNVLNDDIGDVNLADPVSGFHGIPRNMTALPAALAAAGYTRRAAFGKWHVGLATPDHTPAGRGFTDSLVYLDGANDYWANYVGPGGYNEGFCTGPAALTDLWAGDAPAWGRNNSWACSQANQAPGCVWEDDLFTDAAVAFIAAHNASTDGPLFAYVALHAAHEPLEVPADVLAKFAFINDSAPRREYAALVNAADASVGRIIDALTAGGLWDNTLLLVSADNGGPIYGPGLFQTVMKGTAGANNWPLRGGKISPFEGGVRVNAFVSGGVIPPARRGAVEPSLIGVEDWYTTFCGLAGVDPTDARAAAAGLPPVEGFDVWPVISGANATGPRPAVIVGGGTPYPGISASNATTIVQAVVRADGWKLIRGQFNQGVWTGPFYPNASTSWYDAIIDCGGMPPATTNKSGCLYNVFTDPSETMDVSDAHPDIVAALAAVADGAQATAFSPFRGAPIAASCDTAQTKWRGFVGPFLP
jgi:arylsulfatase B